MQKLIQNYLAHEINTPRFPTDLKEFEEAEGEVRKRLEDLMAVKGSQTVDTIHKRLGKIMWDKCGMARSEDGLKEAIRDIQALQNEFWSDVRIPGVVNGMNPELDKAGRVADFLELGELMCRDALDRAESCGGHFREECQTEEGEALRKDDEYAYVAAWEHQSTGGWALHKEALQFEIAKPSQRSYK